MAPSAAGDEPFYHPVFLELAQSPPRGPNRHPYRIGHGVDGALHHAAVRIGKAAHVKEEGTGSAGERQGLYVAARLRLFTADAFGKEPSPFVLITPACDAIQALDERR